VNHFATAKFWDLLGDLPENVRAQANKNFDLLKQGPSHPSLHFKKTGRYWSARVNMNYRALAIQEEQDLIWFWIGDHSAYERLISGS
jgi:hypothetical protein